MKYRTCFKRQVAVASGIDTPARKGIAVELTLKTATPPLGPTPRVSGSKSLTELPPSITSESGTEVVTSPPIFKWRHVVHTNFSRFFNADGSLQNPSRLEYSLELPKQVFIPDFAMDVQADSVRFAEKHGLYQDSAREKAKLRYGKFGVLCSMVYHMLPKDSLQIAADHITALFALDDYLDAGNSEFGRSVSEIKEFIDKIADLFVKAPSESEDLPQREKAIYRAIYNVIDRLKGVILDSLPETSEDSSRSVDDYLEYFKRTLLQYLDSTRVEAAFRSGDSSLNEETYLQNRYYTGGAVHAFGTAFLLQGIRPSTLKDTKLETVIRLASDIVGVSNDVYSVDKDFEDLMEEIKTDSDKSGVEMPTNDDLLRTVIEKIYNNLVLIRVKLGNPDFSSPRSDKMDNFESSKQPQAAISHAATVHNEKVASYFSSRRLVLIDAHKALETGKQRRLELEAIGSRDKSYPKISAQMHASFRLANEYLQIIECLDAWLTGNPLWSILNRRYNSEDYLESLESIKHRAGEIGVELVIK